LKKLLFLFLLACLCSRPAHADTPQTYCGGYSVTSCTITISANQEILLDAVVAANTDTWLDTLGMTFHLAYCDQQNFPSSPGGANDGWYDCHWWARSGALSGSDTFTFSVANLQIWIGAYNNTDLDVTVANPVDAHLVSNGTVPLCSGSSVNYCYDAGNITTSVAHDIVDEIFHWPYCAGAYYGFLTSPPTFGAISLVQEGPTSGLQSSWGNGCEANFNIHCVSVCSSGVYGFTDSGGAGTSDVAFVFNSVNGYYHYVGVSVVTYKGVPHGARPVRQRVNICWLLPFGFPFRRKIIESQRRSEPRCRRGES
jgi:hypothetical protein